MTDRQLRAKAIKFKGSDYVQVKDRIEYLAENYDGRYDLLSDYQYFPEQKMRVVKATLRIRDEKHEKYSEYNWLAQEIEDTTFINKTSALENAESSARGRCCAAFNVWVISSIASMDEINKANNRQAYIDKKAKDKEVMNDSPFVKEKKVFDSAAFENLKLKKDMYTFEEAKKMIDENYTISTEYEWKVMELYWVGAWEVLF